MFEVVFQTVTLLNLFDFIAISAIFAELEVVESSYKPMEMLAFLFPVDYFMLLLLNFKPISF